LNQLHMDFVYFVQSDELHGCRFFIFFQQLWELNSHFFMILCYDKVVTNEEQNNEF
jgi:hypothetical protein